MVGPIVTTAPGLSPWLLAYGPVTLGGLGWLVLRIGHVLREVRDTKGEVRQIKRMAKQNQRGVRAAHRRLDLTPGAPTRRWDDE